MDINEKRATKREDMQMVPQPVKGEPGLVQVDTTWGKIQAMQVDENVRTVDEIEVNQFLETNQQVIDGRTADFYNKSTIPGAKNIPHNEITQRMGELDRNQPAIFFCNGPQCPQSPTAIRNLLEAGYPPDKILYYRGGMHDWVTLGLPVEDKKQ
ncbi:MAG: rhodanese-like domain-containing protein [Bacteroidales bacterium]|jgi:rhodanese-related sulfurtransferase|nr:rhodanese-like domain-containing protein [Bacteroidales bacterium]